METIDIERVIGSQESIVHYLREAPNDPLKRDAANMIVDLAKQLAEAQVKALWAENDLLKLQARAKALDFDSLDCILESLESDDYKSDVAGEEALLKDAWRFRHCVDRKDFPIFWISSSGKEVWSTGIGVLPAFETAAECADAGTVYFNAGKVQA